MSFLGYLPFLAGLGCGVLAIAAMLLPDRAPARGPFVCGMVLLSLEALCTGTIAFAPTAAEAAAWHAARIGIISLVPAAWVIFSARYGRATAPVPPRRRWLTGALVAAPPVLAAMFRDELVVSLARPGDGPPWEFALGRAGVAVYVLVLASAILILANLEQTYRQAAGVMRWRIKFMLFGAGLLFIVRVYTSTHVLLFRHLAPPLAAVEAAALLSASALVLRSLLRRGHFATRVYLSGPVLRGSVTLCLVGLYLVSAALLARRARGLGGDAQFVLQTLVMLLALVTLGVLLQSDRLRLRLRRLISRHFRRPVFDYQAVWQQFARGTGSCGDALQLCRALTRLMAQTLDALSVTLWLVDARQARIHCGASTGLSDGQIRELSLSPAEVTALLSYFRDRHDVLDLTACTEPWAAALESWPPRQFATGVNRVCVPMLARGEVLGLVVVDDRVSGVRFGPAEFDLLECVADHAAATLLGVQLAQRLREASQLEAFQKVAAFFVHDVKNAASTLNLMVQNLRVHFNTPEFREDALRGLTDTMGHMNRMVSTLGFMRHELEVELVEGDLNAVVTTAVAGWQRFAPVIRPLPPVRLDPEQMAKVVMNLVRNAIEAAGEGGQVRVATETRAGWAVLTVKDNGCGMDAEFVAQRLFRPFQTTKRGGLGIGMFQSRMIVEAHGGRIDVASACGHGTTVEVWLPPAEHATELTPAPLSGAAPCPACCESS